MRCLLPGLSALLLLLAPAAAGAHHDDRHHHHRDRNRHREEAQGAGGFDYYLLSLSIAPSFCALSPHNAASAECRALTPASYHATPLTVHGLWPNRSFVSAGRQPQHCPAAPFAPLPSGLQSALDRYMPGGAGLERHEWERHGSCSGLSETDYFAAILRLARTADDSLGATLRQRGLFGSEVRVDALRVGLAQRDPGLAAALVVSCRSPRGGGRALVDEIRLTVGRDLAPIPAARVGLGANSGCPSGAGFLPG